MGRDEALHKDSETLRVAIIVGVFCLFAPLPILPSLPFLDPNQMTKTLIDANERTTELPPQNRRLQHHTRVPSAAPRRHAHARLLGPESDMWEYVSARRAVEDVSGVEVGVMSLLSSITSSHPTPLLPR
jgi:hypothetical protein